MAKLSERQKNNLTAKWNTGQYDKKQLAKLYKISDVMVGKIVGKEKPTNTHLVEASLVVEKAKKFEKSSTEVREIENAVKYRLENEFQDDKKRVKVYATTDKILDKVNALLDKGKKQIVMKVKDYSKESGSSESLDVVDVELDTTDLKNMQDTVDKASLTNGVNQRHSNQVINNTNAQQTIQTPKSIDDFYNE